MPATKDDEADEALLLPIEFVAVTVHVYVRPFDSAPTVTGELPLMFNRVRPPLLDVHMTR